jgi:UDP-N-acetylglucosamine 2-epimerase
MLGITEEATAFGVPSLVLRLTTDRPEGVLAGASRIIGSEKVREMCFFPLRSVRHVVVRISILTILTSS